MTFNFHFQVVGLSKLPFLQVFGRCCLVDANSQHCFHLLPNERKYWDGGKKEALGCKVPHAWANSWNSANRLKHVPSFSNSPKCEVAMFKIFMKYWSWDRVCCFSENLVRLYDLDCIPVALDIRWNDEDSSASVTLEEQQEKWHKPCSMTINTTKIRRTETRECADPRTSWTNFTRMSMKEDEQNETNIYPSSLTSHHQHNVNFTEHQFLALTHVFRNGC